MKQEPFVHLHVHTCFSLLDGACRISDLIEGAAANDMPAVAITDHGVMYGVIEFYQAALARGVKPLLGCEVYVAQGSRLDKESRGRSSNSNHLVLLAEDNAGYENLVKLVTAAHIEGFYYKPRIDKELLAQHSRGLIGLSSCLKGEITSSLAEDDLERAVRVTGEYADILGRDSFFIEMQDHGLPEQRRVNLRMQELSHRTGVPLVPTNDVHYMKKEDAAAHEVLLCLQTQTVMSDPKRMRYRSEDFYLKTRAEMEDLFRDFPEAVNRTVEIAERCNVELEFGTLHFPTFDVPEGTSQRRHLEQLALEGLKPRYAIEDPRNPADDRERGIVERFRHELEVIDKEGFVNYFLVVWDFVRFAREKKIPVGPGRGSGGGSLIAFALGITAIDPLEYDLIFERFLNPERVSPPDFDIDFCQARRGEVIDYVKDRYGRENVAQIITFGSLGAKTVIRDVGRVLEVSFGQCDRLAKMVPDDLKMTLKRALEMNPEFKRAYENEEDCKRILDFGFVLEGLYRNPGTHAAGVVIGEKPLREIIPLARDKDGEPVTQFTMEPLGDLGLLKMDFLGLKTLTVIQETVELIEEFHGQTLDIEGLPMDDKATYELLNRGDTVGVFQLESAGMRDLIRRISIDRIQDLIAMIALYRPGPMNMLPDYVERKSGRSKTAYDHPLLEPILKETYGVMVYQEQVQKAANVLAGYSLGEADVLRRAMGKKKPDVMERQRAKFVEGCGATSRIPRAQAGRIFDTMAQFAGYGFNKAHSAGYAIISYQTAYLKANFPAEFMSALLSSEIGNFDKLPVFIAEAAEMGLRILPPDVNASGTRFQPSDDGIRFGLAGIKNVGAAATESIVNEQKTKGPYKGLVDLCCRIDPQLVNRKVLESLVRCGAMDGLGMHRARLFNGIDFAMARAADALRDRRTGQGSLFDLMGADQQSSAADDLPDCEAWPERELLAAEKELLGIYMSGHPLTQYTGLLEKYRLTTVRGVSELRDRTATRIGGIISSVAKRMTKRKEPMAILQIEDLEGSIEVLVFPEAYRKYGDVITPEAAVLVCGDATNGEETPKLMAHEVYPLDEAPRHFAERLSIHVPVAHSEQGHLDAVRELLRLHPGKTPVVICLRFPSGEKVFFDTDKGLTVTPDRALLHELEQVLGECSVYVHASSKPCLTPVNGRRARYRNGGNDNGNRRPRTG